jgi:hypothetical protein
MRIKRNIIKNIYDSVPIKTIKIKMTHQMVLKFINIF